MNISKMYEKCEVNDISELSLARYPVAGIVNDFRVVSVSISPNHLLTNTFPLHALNLIMKARKKCENMRTEKTDHCAKTLLGE